MDFSRNIGDPCFAKVKGWIPYPAKIVGRKENKNNKKRTMFSVLFYQTKETGEIRSENVWSVTPETVRKFVNPKSLLRKNFKLAVCEMEEHHKISIGDTNENGDKVELGNDLIIDNALRMSEEGSDTRESSEKVPEQVQNLLVGNTMDMVMEMSEHLSECDREKDFQDESDEDDQEFDFDDIFRGPVKRYLVENKSEVKEQENLVQEEVLNTGNEMEETAIEDEQDHSTLDTVRSWVCDECGASFVDKKVFMNHVFDHVLNKAAVAAKEANAVKNNIGANSDSQSKSGPEASKQSAAKLSDEPPSTKKQIKANKGKKTKGKVSGIISKGKTLRESEMEVNEAFADKIVVKEDNTFHCRFCPLFVTSVKLLAKSHAQSCDTKKKKGRLAKRIQCNECGETFTGKKNLVKHTRESHSMPSYQCSTCMKKFKYRVYYMRHLKIHDRQPSVSCPYCSQKFRFESYKLRHIDRVHRMKLSSPQNEQENDGGEVMIEVRDEEKRLGENFFWKYEATFPNLDRAKVQFVWEFL